MSGNYKIDLTKIRHEKGRVLTVDRENRKQRLKERITQFRVTESREKLKKDLR